MKNNERQLLYRLMVVCNKLGSSLDLTATHILKLHDRQRALMLVSNVLYGLLAQHPDNEYSSDDMDKSLSSLNKLEILIDKKYPDKNGVL